MDVSALDRDKAAVTGSAAKGAPPDVACSFVDRLLFRFCDPMLRKGFRTELTQDDIWALRPSLSSSGAHVERLRQCWEQEVASHDPPNLLRALLRANARTIARQMAFSVCWAALVVVGPAWFLPNILLFLQDPTWVSWVGWVLVASLFVTQVAVALVAARMLWANSAFAISVRSAVTRLLVDKMCVLASTSKVAAHVLNVRSNDLQRIFMMFMFTPILAGGVSGLLGVCVALLARFDVAGLPPAGVLLLSFLANQLLSRLASRFSARVLPLTDQRVKLMSHIVRAIAVVKLFAWEELLGQRVASVRRQELEQRQKAATVAAVLEAVALSTILIASLLFLVTWSLLGRPFVASDVFTGVSLVIIGRIPLIQVQLFAQYTGEARSSFGRIAGVLLLPSLAPSAVQVDRVAEGATAGVVARDAVLRPGGEDEFSLSNLSFSCGAGEVVCVVGQVGSGKSTLLLGVIQALPAVAGAIKTTGNCAYVPQEQFLINSSLRNNVLFGSPLDEERYQRALHCCCLGADLLQLVDGDRTEIGAFGVNISGGQKSRVALARAVYASGRQILALDDPFSALDAHVGRVVFERLVKETRAENKLLIVSTHQLHLAQQASSILCLANGKLCEQGSFETLLAIEGGAFRGMMEQYSDEQKKQPDNHDILSLERKRPLLTTSGMTATAVTAGPTKTLYALVKKEESATGSVSWSVWRTWVSGMGPGGLGVLLLAISAFGTQGFMDFWISYWVGNSLGLTTQSYLGVYAALTVIVLMGYYAYLCCFWPLALCASQALHNRALARVLQGTMSWFESVPSGRVLNRFAKDVDVTDQGLPDAFKVFFGNLLQLLMFAVVISVAFPYFLIALFPVCALFVAVTVYFNRSNRQIRRIEALVRSPVFSEISTLLTGLQTLRVYGQTREFADQLLARADTFSSAVFMFWSLSRWLALRLDLTCSVVVLVASVIAVSLRGVVSASFAAIAITYSMRMSSFLQWTFRNLSIMESSAVSAERLIEFANDIPTEPQGGSSDVPENWPDKGEIEFDNVSVRYAPQLPLSLRSLQLRVGAGQHVGVVGRTGAGKSTLASVLFRLRELDSGVIRIDGIDISLLSLKTLRSRLSIITQESVLFQGSLRFNLDPFDMRSNDELWAVLRRVGLDALVGEAGGLEFPVEDGGANLSAGERQVLCLARVMLSRSAVVVLDEATSNVDSAFDQVIQSVVREEFRSSTILCIAHRLHTIIDSDRVLLLDKGELMEYDAPAKLVQRPSMFRDLLLDTGIESSRSLIRAATLARGVGKAGAPDAECAQQEEEEEEDAPYWHAYAGDFDVTRVDV